MLMNNKYICWNSVGVFFMSWLYLSVLRKLSPSVSALSYFPFQPGAHMSFIRAWPQRGELQLLFILPREQIRASSHNLGCLVEYLINVFMFHGFLMNKIVNFVQIFFCLLSSTFNCMSLVSSGTIMHPQRISLTPAALAGWRMREYKQFMA